MSQIRIAVWSDTRLFAEGLAELVSRDASLCVVAWQERVTADVSAMPPDVLLIDAAREGALAACARLRQSGDRPRIILIGPSDSGRFALQALEGGARGILGPDAGVGEVLKAIRIVHGGQIWAAGDVIARSVEELVDLCESKRVQQSAFDRLTNREEQVARQVAMGRGNRKIADSLAISQATVKAHVTRIFQKLGVRSRAELAAGWAAPLPAELPAGEVQVVRPKAIPPGRSAH